MDPEDSLSHTQLATIALHRVVAENFTLLYKLPVVVGIVIAVHCHL
jgi:hypothetical protein